MFVPLLDVFGDEMTGSEKTSSNHHQPEQSEVSVRGGDMDHSMDSGGLKILLHKIRHRYVSSDEQQKYELETWQVWIV